MKEKLFGKSLEELDRVAAEYGFPRYGANQMARWLYRGRISSIDEMTDVSKARREALKGDYTVGVAPPSRCAVSADGTKKYLFHTGDHAVETAWIPDKKRGTLCVSTQMGCRRGCRFCMTARQGFQGNLSTGEILDQYRSLPEYAAVTHFVFMGMGEPLDNLEAVLGALNILTADWGYAFSPKKVTVSTIGILDGFGKLLDASECRIALSVHSPYPQERSRIIPYERRYPLAEMVEFIRRTSADRDRRITVEYLMIDGFNDSSAHARDLGKLFQGLKIRINLIPYHPIPDFDGKPSPPERIVAFENELKRRGFVATIRRSRGLDIEAACGLLSTKTNR
jgi:23S rRNA (adenine2503-C2)-methyltransferase